MRAQLLEDAARAIRQSTTPIAQIDPVPRVSIQAFCESPEAAAVVQAAIGDRRMSKAHVKQNMGGAAAAVEAYRNAPTPNVIVIEATADRDAARQPARRTLRILRRRHQGHHHRQGQRHRSLPSVDRARGQRISGAAVRRRRFRQRGLASVQARRAPSRSAASIAVVGAKGGVGSSTVAHNLAWHFATGLGMDTIIADLDLGFGTAGLDFNQDPPQGIAEAVFAPDRVDATLVDRLLSKCGDNLHLLAAPAMLDRLYDFGETAFDSLIDAMRASTPWIVLDVPHGWTAWTRRMLVGADEVIVVAAARSRQPAQRQEHHRQHPQRAPARPSAAAGPERRRHAQAAGDSGRRFRQDDRDRADRGHPARRQAVRLGRQQRPDDRRDRAEGQSRRDLRRSGQR